MGGSFFEAIFLKVVFKGDLEDACQVFGNNFEVMMVDSVPLCLLLRNFLIFRACLKALEKVNSVQAEISKTDQERANSGKIRQAKVDHSI